MIACSHCVSRVQITFSFFLLDALHDADLQNDSNSRSLVAQFFGTKSWISRFLDRKNLRFSTSRETSAITWWFIARVPTLRNRITRILYCSFSRFAIIIYLDVCRQYTSYDVPLFDEFIVHCDKTDDDGRVKRFFSLPRVHARV